jgi:hypothetical protein
MSHHLTLCQKVADRYIKELSDDGYNCGETRPLCEVVGFLQSITKHEFGSTKVTAEKLLKQWIEEDELKLWSFSVTRVSLCLPLGRESSHEFFTSATCPVLWNGLSWRCGAYLKKLSTITSVKTANKSELFSRVFHAFICFMKSYGLYYDSDY